ncbi:MAG: amidohydrolase [Thermoplasmata archaeon]
MGDAHLWSGGRIFTGTGYSEALLIEGGRVRFVGRLAEAHRATPTGAERHDLGGDLLIPGLIDAHLHLAEMAIEAHGVDVRTVTSTDELLERVAQWAGDHDEGPVVGRGWSLPSCTETEWPTRRDLDRVAGGRPVVLFHASGHAAVVNSVALDRLHLDRAARDPEGGRLGRDSRGEPNGLLFESALSGASGLARESLRDGPETLGGVIADLPRWGITAVGTMNTSSAELEALRSLDARGAMPVRVSAYLGLRWFASLDEAAIDVEIREGSRLTVAGVKGFADGAFGTRTARLSRPYADNPSTSGMDVDTIRSMTDGFTRAHRHGIGAAAHALGDLGLEHALDAIERCDPAPTGVRDRIEHAGLVPPPLRSRLERMQPVVVVQPIFLWSDAWLSERLGPERVRSAYPFGSMLRSGIVLAGSSDAPFDALDPWTGMHAAIERTDGGGRSANPLTSEALDAESAVRIYTAGGAAALGRLELGVLAPGRSADLVRLDAPSLEGAIRRGAQAVRETWSAGVQTYARR